MKLTIFAVLFACVLALSLAGRPGVSTLYICHYSSKEALVIWSH